MDLSAKPCSRKPYLKARSKDDGRMKATFRGAARQVWIANSLSKHHRGVENDLKTSENNPKMALYTAFDVPPSSPNRPPSVKRRATPDIFPMSSEMRKTLVLLGNLDLLPEEEKQKQEELAQAEKKKKLNSFRQKAQIRVIQPQRIIRSLRNGGNSKIVNKNTSELENTTGKTAELLINSISGNDTNSTLCSTADETGKKNDLSKLENISPSEEKDGNYIEDFKRDSLILNLSLREHKRSAKSPWRTAIKRHQLGQVEPNPENPFFVRKRFHPLKKDFTKISKTWQPRSKLQEKFPNIQRAKTFPPRALSSKLKDLNINKIDYTEPINDGKTIDEITSDIQERCSKWFEFRQKILAKSHELKYS